jgi:hypothetical protein
MTYTGDQIVMMAREFAHVADQGRSPRCVEVLGRLADRTGLTARQCLAQIRMIAAMPHPLDAAAGAMWAEAFRAA